MSPEGFPKRVLVTGAAGFLGGRVVEGLRLSGLAQPRAGLRIWSRAARVARWGVELVCFDILQRDQIPPALQGVDAIVHCASAGDHDSIVEGTRNLLWAAREQGIRQFVHISTAEVYGPSVRGNVTEQTPLQPSDSEYANAKIEAEAVCAESRQQGLGPTILRPSIIYGPFSVSWSIDIAERLLSGHWTRFEEHGDGWANLVYVDDLVQAILRVLARPQAMGKTINVNGPDRVTWNEYFERFNAALGRPPLPISSASASRLRANTVEWIRRGVGLVRSRFENPLMEIYLRGGRLSRWMKQLKQRLNSAPSQDELQRLYSRRAWYDDHLARTCLGYQPQFDLATGLALTVEWLRQHERVPAAQVEIKSRAPLRVATSQLSPPPDTRAPTFGQAQPMQVPQ